MIYLDKPENVELKFLRKILLLAGIIIPLAGFLVYVQAPELNDPIELRVTLGVLLIIVWASSYFSAFVKRNLVYAIYSLIFLGIIWVNVLLRFNQLAPLYVINSFLILFGCSLMLRSKQHLKIYLLVFTVVTMTNVWAVSEPKFSTLAYTIEFVIIVALDWHAMSYVFNSRSSLILKEKKFSTLAKYADAVLVLVDKDMRIVSANDLARKLALIVLGKNLKDGSEMNRYIWPSERDFFLRNYRKVMNGETVEVEKKWNLLPGVAYWHEMKGIPLALNYSNKIDHVLFIARNIDHHKKAEKAIQNTNTELRKVNTELDQFIYKAAHDLRAPIASIKGLINLSQMDNSPDAVSRNLKLMMSSMDILDNIIQDITDFSRNVRTDLRLELIDTKGVIDKILDDFNVIISDKKVICTFDIQDSAPFFSDLDRVNILLRNIISNGLKFQDPYKQSHILHFVLDCKHDKFSVTIEDNGVGIKEEYLNKVFDLFFRGSDMFCGSGLGLYISREVASKLGGDVQINSIHGKGTTVKVSIPNRQKEFDLNSKFQEIQQSFSEN